MKNKRHLLRQISNVHNLETFGFLDASPFVQRLYIADVLDFTTKYVEMKRDPIVPLSWEKTHMACKDWELQKVCDVRVSVHVPRKYLK